MSLLRRVMACALFEVLFGCLTRDSSHPSIPETSRLMVTCRLGYIYIYIYIYICRLHVD